MENMGPLLNCIKDKQGNMQINETILKSRAEYIE